MLGFLSGVSFMRSGADPLAGTDVQGIMAWHGRHGLATTARSTRRKVRGRCGVILRQPSPPMTEGRTAAQGRYGGAYAAVREMVTANPAMTLAAISAALAGRGLPAMGQHGTCKPFTRAQVNRFVAALRLHRIDGRTRRGKGEGAP